MAAAVVAQAVESLEELFALPTARGNDMLAASVVPLENEATGAALVEELMLILGGQSPV